MRFLSPWFLALIFPALAFILWRGRKTGTRYTYSITAFVAGFRSRWIMRLVQALLLIALLGMIAGLGRPVTDGGLVPTVTRSRDTIFLIDRSGSMNFPYSRSSEAGTQGMPPFGVRTSGPSQTSGTSQEPTKYDLARDLAAKFIESRPDDRLTACVFFDYFFYGYYEYRIVCPAPLDKYDHDVISRWLRIPDKAEGGTPMGQAMISALEHLDEMGQSGERTLVVLSDGDGTWSPEMEVTIAKLFAKTHTKLYWVFIENASTMDYQTKADRWTASQRGLLRLVTATNGRRFVADSPEHLAQALEAVKRLSTEPVIVRLPVPQRDLYPFVVTSSIAVFLLVFAAIRVWIR